MIWIYLLSMLHFDFANGFKSDMLIQTCSYHIDKKPTIAPYPDNTEYKYQFLFIGTKVYWRQGKSYRRYDKCIYEKVPKLHYQAIPM